MLNLLNHVACGEGPWFNNFFVFANNNGFARCLVQVVYRVHYGFYCSLCKGPCHWKENVWAIFRVHLQMLKTMRLRIAPINQ